MVIIGKFQDLTGQRFGKLTVIKRVNNDKKNKVRWLCECDCGKQHTTITYNLTHGLCKSCGCGSGFAVYNQKYKKYNTYDLSGESAIGYTVKGEKYYFDLADYDKIKDYCWRINYGGYVVAKRIDNNKHILMHRLIMNVTKQDVLVDHIYHNKTDNRKSQLRLVTFQQNATNNALRKNNTSGYKGVYWHKPAQKWEALIQYNNHLYNLGLYSNIEDAVKAREQAEIKYFDEYRYQENPNSTDSNI